MAKGKLVKFEKLMVNGVHSTWENQGKVNYKFVVEFDNGDKGTCQKQDPEGKGSDSLEKDIEYTYDKDVKGNYTNIKNLKRTDKPAFVPGGNKGPNTYNDPELIRYSYRGTSVMQATLIHKSFNLEKIEVADKIAKFFEDAVSKYKDTFKIEKEAATTLQSIFKSVVEDHLNTPYPSLETLFTKVIQYVDWITKK